MTAGAGACHGAFAIRWRVRVDAAWREDAPWACQAQGDAARNASCALTNE